MQFQKVQKNNEKVTKPSNTIKITTRKYIIQTMTNNSNKKNKSKTNLSTKSIVSSKSSSLSTTRKSATTIPKLTATPKSLKKLRNPNGKLFLCPPQK